MKNEKLSVFLGFLLFGFGGFLVTLSTWSILGDESLILGPGMGIVIWSGIFLKCFVRFKVAAISFIVFTVILYLFILLVVLDVINKETYRIISFGFGLVPILPSLFSGDSSGEGSVKSEKGGTKPKETKTQEAYPGTFSHDSRYHLENPSNKSPGIPEVPKRIIEHLDMRGNTTGSSIFDKDTIHNFGKWGGLRVLVLLRET